MSNQPLLPLSLESVPLPSPLPPLVLMAFTRPDLLVQVLAGIRQQTLQPEQIIAFVDGPRKPADQPLVQACIDLLQEFSRTVPVQIVARPENLGRHPQGNLNVILGLTQVCHHHPSLVYLEDDIVPNPWFYDRICRLLAAYQDHPQVFSVSAYANFPAELADLIETDFMVSNRIFSWGFGIWADRWLSLDLAHQPPPYNPFGRFYQIPATHQTKFTLINQFWLEYNDKTDWVIALSLGALYQQKVHITPKVSLVQNVGFGHPEAKTYRGAEAAWVNAHYDPDPDPIPHALPPSLELFAPIQSPLGGRELVAHLATDRQLWLHPRAFWYLLQQQSRGSDRLALTRFFLARLPQLGQRWRSGRPI